MLLQRHREPVKASAPEMQRPGGSSALFDAQRSRTTIMEGVAAVPIELWQRILAHAGSAADALSLAATCRHLTAALESMPQQYLVGLERKRLECVASPRQHEHSCRTCRSWGLFRDVARWKGPMGTQPGQRTEIDLHRHARCHKCLADERRLFVAATRCYTRYAFSLETGRWRKIKPSDWQYTLLCRGCLDEEMANTYSFGSESVRPIVERFKRDYRDHDLVERQDYPWESSATLPRGTARRLFVCDWRWCKHSTLDPAYKRLVLSRSEESAMLRRPAPHGARQRAMAAVVL